MDSVRNFIHLYNEFHDACGHDATSDKCLAKLAEECREFLVAYESGDHDAIVDERRDVLNTAMYSSYKDGIHNILFFGWQKLQANLERYRKEGKIPQI